MKVSGDKAIVEYIESLSDFQRDLVLKVREVVLSADKQVNEGIKWGSIAFFNENNICGFRVAKAHVTLLFMEGAMLNDKKNILTGTGPKARSVKMKDVDKVPSAAIKDLVKQAITLGM